MQATTVEILAMLGSWFSGIGAISAVIYAMRVNQPQIGALVSDIQFYNDGEFTIDIFNNKSINCHISYIRLVKKRYFNFGHDLPSKFSYHGIVIGSDNKQSDRTDITVEPGGNIRLKFSASSLLNAYCELQDIQKVTGMTRMIKAQIAIYLTNGSVKYVDLPISQYQKIKNVVFSYACNRIDTIIKLGRKNFPSDYSFEQIQKLQQQALNDYDKAYKRHMYLLQPVGITMEDFFSNR